MPAGLSHDASCLKAFEDGHSKRSKQATQMARNGKCADENCTRRATTKTNLG